MSRRSLAVLLSLPLTAVTYLALREEGLQGFLNLHRASWGGLQVFADLVIMALLACAWMVLEAGARRRRAWPFVGLTLLAGSYGPLAYLASSGPGPEGILPRPLPRWAWLLLLAVTAAFGALSAKALLAHGYLGIWRLQFASWTSLQVLVDLVVLGLLACVWMVRDARLRGRTAWPYLLLTLAAGSFGPLAYLLVQGREPGRSEA